MPGLDEIQLMLIAMGVPNGRETSLLPLPYFQMWLLHLKQAGACHQVELKYNKTLCCRKEEEICWI